MKKRSKRYKQILKSAIKGKKITSKDALDLIKKMDRVFSLTKNGFKEMK